MTFFEICLIVLPVCAVLFRFLCKPPKKIVRLILLVLLLLLIAYGIYIAVSYNSFATSAPLYAHLLLRLFMPALSLAVCSVLLLIKKK